MLLFRGLTTPFCPWQACDAAAVWLIHCDLCLPVKVLFSRDQYCCLCSVWYCWFKILQAAIFICRHAPWLFGVWLQMKNT